MRATKVTSLFAILLIICMVIPSVLCTSTVTTHDPGTTLTTPQTNYELHTRYNSLEKTKTNPIPFQINHQNNYYSQKTSDGTNDIPLPILNPMDSPWPMASHDNKHTGRSPFNTTQNPACVKKWIFAATDDIYSGAVIDQNGIIYFASNDRFLYALYPDGTMKWKTRLAGCH